MARDFEDYCWKDVIDADTLQIYQAYRRKIYVGDNPAVLAIDLYNKAYLGGNRPVKEVDREFSARAARTRGTPSRRRRNSSPPRGAPISRSSTPPAMSTLAGCSR